MPTSQDGYYTRFTESVLAAEQAADAAHCARALDNLNHLADQYAETLVAWAGTTLGVAEASPADEVIYPIWYSTPFDLRLQEDGTSYPMRCSIRVTSSHVSQSSIFWVVVAEATQLVEDRGTIGTAIEATNADGVSVAQTTTTWEDTKLLQLDARSALTATKAVITTDVLPFVGAPGFWCRAVLAIYASSETSAVALLSGASLCQYLPPS